MISPPETTEQPTPALSARVAVLALLWALAVLASYALLRTTDLRPLLSALGQRALDVAVPIGLTILTLPCGSRLLRRYGGPVRDAGGHLLLAAAVGLGLLMLWGTLTAALGLLHPAPAATLVGGALLAAATGGREWFAVTADARTLIAELRQRPIGGALICGAAVAAVTLVMAATPPISQDALHYHLAVPQLWLAAGGLEEIPGNIYSRFPMNVEMLYLTGLGIRGEIAAKLFHWWLSLGAALAIVRLAGRFAPAPAARWAGVVFLAVPTVFQLASWAYVGMGVVFYLISAWIVCEEERDQPGGRELLLGFLLGVGCGIKYTFLLPALILALWMTVRAPQARWRYGTRLALMALVGGGFWYLRNLWQLGNPCYPFLYSWFGGAGWDGERAAAFAAFLQQWGHGGWDLPLRATYAAQFSSIENFDGVLGPVYLLGAPLVLAALWARPATRRSGVLAALLLLSWWSTTHQMRFLVPALAVLAALIPAGWYAFESLRARAWARRLTIVGVLFSLAAPLQMLTWQAPLAFAVGQESRDAYLERTLPGDDYEVFRRIPELVGPQERILFAGSGNPIYLCPRPFHADSLVENYTLRRLLAEAENGDQFAADFRAAGFQHLLFRFHLVFNSPGYESDLSLAEQQRLSMALNQHGELLVAAGGTFLYRVGGRERGHHEPR